MHADVLDRFALAFAASGFRRDALQPCYGLAESTLLVTAAPRHTPSGRKIVGTRTLVGLGHPHRATRVEIVDPHTSLPCSEGDVGEVWVSGPSVASGYWQRPEETERTFRGFLAETGEGPFLRTGDLGCVCAGELFLTGRIKDLVILRGIKHHSEDLEYTALRCHPALRDRRAAAFAVDGGVEGEKLVVLAESDTGAPFAEFEEAARRAVATGHGALIDVFAVVRTGALPRTTSGKIRRAASREEFLSGRLKLLHAGRAN